ncbi:MAG: hypothetical protein ACI841_003537 [Planctomycetota bacterium]|jgi:hypothetical protein
MTRTIAHLICRTLEVGVALGTVVAFDRLSNYF